MPAPPICIDKVAGLLLVLTLVLPPTLWAQPDEEAVPTQVMVRVHSNDAKLLQDPVGGARITIRDAASGAVLDEGRVEGSSGSTEQIIREPRERGTFIFDTPGAAGYLATLELEEPTQVEITAEGPLDYPEAMQRATKTLWLVPGEDVLGDGVVLTVHGFIVEVTETTPATAAPEEKLRVRARVSMLCGCPTEPGGLWNADRYTITAQLLRDGEVVAETPMQYAGTTSHYEGAVTIPEQGVTAVRVLASDAERANFGVSTQALTGE